MSIAATSSSVTLPPVEQDNAATLFAQAIQGQTIIGDKGNERLRGDEGNDEIRGNDGNDVIFGGDGDDLLVGGNGNDTIEDGYYGNDRIFGDEGNDEINGGSGNDEMYGGAGDDTISSYASESTNDGNDIIHGGSGNDFISGGDGSNRIYGEEGNDTISIIPETRQGYSSFIDGGFGEDTLDLDSLYGNDTPEAVVIIQQQNGHAYNIYASLNMNDPISAYGTSLATFTNIEHVTFDNRRTAEDEPVIIPQ